jgi:uncharacterized membrane protein
MKYSSRELRAADFFAVLLVGIGVLFSLIGIVVLNVSVALVGGVFICLAISLNRVLLDVMKNGGMDPAADIAEQASQSSRHQ